MLFAWMTMLGSASCLRAGRHLSISALVAAVSARVRNVLLWLRDAAILAAFGILGVASYRFAMMNADQESPTLEVPLTLHYSAVIVGTVLMALLLILSRYLGRPIPLEQVDDGAVSL